MFFGVWTRHSGIGFNPSNREEETDEFKANLGYTDPVKQRNTIFLGDEVAERMEGSPSSIKPWLAPSPVPSKSDMMVHLCSSITWEVEAGGSAV